ncbi:DHH family phosphoesterase [archaeon]|jgi:single-stranded DNA-specific DHH superfamily exonuclease|nr:DHH family phosphoesterase [archaeon]MBT3731149.1 DHH family phosphoesterase [archaeon]MBT4670097.1 DHH family phosphoesterase [archaeon]MBT5030603.1 DHH family phosphoesterase [archaeon]MBT5287955.1 DHH family phosphoesterase [archaeon]
MITEEQIKEIRELIKQANNPMILFDDDQDGLCSFLLIKKYLGKGYGLPYVYRDGNENDFLIENIHNNNHDLLIFLDVPFIDQYFLDKITEIPIVHIDHHPPHNLKAKNYHYFNPMLNDKENNLSTTYWAYKISEGPEWLASIGIIADWFIPPFYKELQKKYPDLLPKTVKSPGDVYFKSNLSELIKGYAFCLKGKREDVRSNINTLLKIEDPYEILEEKTPAGKKIKKYYSKRLKRYNKMLNDALDSYKSLDSKDNLFVYTYVSGKDSFSSMLSTELTYHIKAKVLCIARVKEGETIISWRSRKVSLPDKIQIALEGLQGRGGGHKLACGTGIKNEDFPEFLKRMKDLIDEDLNK